MPMESSANLGEKVELHCHSDGLVDGQLLRGLAERGDLYPVDPDELARLVPVTSLAGWMGAYSQLVRTCMTPFERLLPILAAHTDRLVAQRVSYAELMVSGLLDPYGDEGAAIERFQRVEETVARRGQGAIRVELLAAIGRGRPERVERQASRILALARHGLIAGIAIAGDESACTIRSIAPVLRRLRDAGLGIEIHAGEFAGPESVRDALEHGEPERIGHGVRAFEDERLIEEICRRDVHLEFCLTSNLCLGVVRDLTEHPIVRAHALGMNFSVNTDDPGPFGCSMTSEFALLERCLGFTASDFERIRANAWRSRFSAKAPRRMAGQPERKR
jgi:adenosine deaminase